jgi:Domain of unknown function (DUF4190)/GYF domain 2
MYRIIGVDGREYGPIPEETLRQWIIQGRANAATPALAPGGTEWKPLGSLAEFSMLFAAVTQPASYSGAQISSQKNTGAATTGMVLGILSLTVGLCCYGFPFNIIGLIFSIIALGQIKSNPQQYGGRGMAITGLVLCIASLALALLLLIAVVIGSILSPEPHNHGYRL